MINVKYFIFLLIIVFFSCSTYEEIALSSSNPVTYNWYFEIKVDGVSNRIEGSFSDDSYSNALAHTLGPNGLFNILRL